MSLQALAWVAESLPADIKPGPRVILNVLANHVGGGDAWTGAYPSIATIAERSGMSRSTVHRHMKTLEERGAIVRGDQNLVSHYPADRRPVVWNIEPDTSKWGTGCQTDTPPRGVKTEHTGCQNEPHGVSKSTERGVTPDTQTINKPTTNQNMNHYPPLRAGSDAHSAGSYPADFEQWWSAYPRKTGKAAALTKWRTAVKTMGSPQLLLDALLERLPELESHETRFIPHPATWLGQGRFHDPVKAPEPRKRTGMSPDDWLPEEYIAARDQQAHAAALDWTDPTIIDGEIVTTDEPEF